jgi:hypothetical protein
MSIYYENADQLYEIYGKFMEKILTDEKIGPKMSKSGIIINFIYTDPDSEITIDLKNPPRKGTTATITSARATSRQMSGPSRPRISHTRSGTASRTRSPRSRAARSSRAVR